MEFAKIQGTGNDFVIVDNRNGEFDRFCEGLPLEFVVRKICERRTGVGADGLILVEESETADLKWRFYNSDGSTAEMCGNGARCVSRFAFEKGIVKKSNMRIETLAGIIETQVLGENVRVKLTPPKDLKLNVEAEGLEVHYVNTGVPHVVLFVSRLDLVDVRDVGRRLRFSEVFSPSGVNVNFVEVGLNGIAVRTYERGVEDETLACGTGSVASALISSLVYGLKSPVEVEVRTGERLKVYFDDDFKEVYLEGPTVWVYDGKLRRELFERVL
jgi:diaminopimelate epimerase